MSELLEVNHVSYAYHSIDGETETLADISFHIKEGEFAAIVVRAAVENPRCFH